MREFRTPLLIALIFSLMLGLGLGWKLRRDRAAQLGVVTSSRKLRILSLKGALPASALRSFRSAENCQVELIEEPTPDAVFARLEADHSFDLVTLLASQTSRALQATFIQPFALNEISNATNISKDFLDLPVRLPTTVPILWGVLGFAYSSKAVSDLQSWKDVFELDREIRIFMKPLTFEIFRLAKMNMPLPFAENALQDRVKKFNSLYRRSELFFADPALTESGADVIEISSSEASLPAFHDMTFVLPTEKALMWILDLALTSGAKNSEDAKAFANHVLKPEVAIEISTKNHQASTNSAVESSSLPPKQKPSALRQLPLTQLDFLLNDSRN